MKPNALFSEEEIERLKTASDPGLRALVDGLLADAARGAERGSCDMRLLGFAYACTGDRRYADCARRILLDLVREESWIDSGYRPDAYNGFDIRTSLPTASRCVTASLGFALFGDLLSEEDREQVIRETYEKGIYDLLSDWVLPGTRIHALDTMGHNFWCVCISAAALGAVVFCDLIPDGKSLLRQASEALEAWFRYPGNLMNAKPMTFDGGGYYESVGYFDYAMREYLTFAIVHERLTGEHPFDDGDILRAAISFFLSCWYPSNGRKDYFAGFGDYGNEDGNFNSPLYFLRYGIDVPGLRYFLRNRNRKNCDTLLSALLWDEIEAPDPAPPEKLSACYPKIGWAVFHDRWEKDAVMFAVKCGDTWNHAHADCASFLLYRNGKPEIFDPLTPCSYSDPIYQRYYVTSEAHNVLLFDDHGQDFRDNYKNNTHLPGTLRNFTDEDGFRYVAADGTGPMGRYFRKHHRHFLWLDGFILIYDDVECYEAGRVSFLVHGIAGNPFRMLSPAAVKTRTGWIQGDTETADYDVYTTDTDEQHHAKFCGILLLDDGIDPVLTPITDGWRISAGGTTVYVNHRADGKIIHRNCINVMDGWLTDAELLAVKGDRCAVVNGSIVRRGGKSLLETFSRINGWADRTVPSCRPDKTDNGTDIRRRSST